MTVNFYRCEPSPVEQTQLYDLYLSESHLGSGDVEEKERRLGNML